MKYYKNLLAIVLMVAVGIFSSFGMDPSKVTLQELLSNRASGQIIHQQAPTDFSDKTQPLSKRIKSLGEAGLKPAEKKQILKNLQDEHKATPKPRPTRENTVYAPGQPSQFRMAFAEWHKADNLLRLLKTSLSNPTPPRLPDMSAKKLDADLNDLSKSSFFDENNGQDPQENSYSIFKSVAQSLPDRLSVLLGKDQRAAIQSKMDLLDGLNKMSTFIYDYDLNPQDKPSPHKSERCWLLELIKNTILDNNTFTPEMIADWKDQIKNIAIVTEKSRNFKLHGDLFAGSVMELAQQKVKTDQEKNKKANSRKTVRPLSEKDKTEKQRLKNEIDKFAQDIEKNDGNVYDIRLLSPYLTDLKKYKLLLSPITEKEERQDITQRIRITAKQLKAIAIITPRNKSLEATITGALTKYKDELNNPKHQTPENLSEAVIALQGFLATDQYYDPFKVVTNINSDSYINVITALATYTALLNNATQLKKDMTDRIEASHFEELASKIEKLRYLLKSDPNNRQIQGMINSYRNRIQEDTNVLINQINTGKILLEKSLATDYFGDNASELDFFRNQVIETIKEKMNSQQQEKDTAMRQVIQYENDRAEAQRLQEEENAAANFNDIEPRLGHQAGFERDQIPQNQNPELGDDIDPADLQAILEFENAQAQQQAPVPPAPQPFLITRIVTSLWQGMKSVGSGIVSIASGAWNWLASWF